MMLRLSVNLSVQQLQHDSCLAVVEEALRASGLAPQYLDLEITESVIITHPEKAVATLAKLKERGISITVDDFGTGYSSLSYLARLPIEAVKIDQRFVHGLEHNSNDVAITQAIIALSHSLGLRVIAEGVETSAQFEFLKSHGCEAAQGFLIARPLEEPEFLAWWKAQEEETRAVLLQPDMWQPEGRRLGRSGPRRKRSRTLLRAEVVRPVDVAQRAGVVDVDPHEAVAVRRHDRFRAVVAGRAPPAPRSRRRRSPPDARAARDGTAPRPRRRLSIAAATRAIVDGSIHGMSPSATIQPAASGVARTPHARLAPMPSSAFAQRTMRAPAAPSAAASAASSGPHHGDDARQHREEIPARHRRRCIRPRR